MEIADIVFELTPVKNAAGTYQDAFRARFSLIRNRHEYRLWFYPAGTKRSWDAYSFWRCPSPTDKESRSLPIFRMECELVAQAILHEVTTNVSLEDVRVWRPDPSSVEGRARQAIEAAAAGSDPNGAGKDHRSRIRRIRDGASGLGDSPFWAAYWKMAKALINRTMVH